ncbi:hypothetical protein Smp_148110 [Schistosoma mansoni]|uniref:hypothetical protein n=1 Tax=Schistosoma mansoni TaxID=6183 RepID=UPI0001A62F0A|nr:hypothetical protein Smp_148110 [Schistosoma mansoni]|eukprot:XP_018654418.1 hypothetical protein Smp_148110 [Schistosoma mansoni]
MKDCDQCSIAKLGGLQVWMQHLTDEHAIPTEWPSDRATRLTGSNALRPYTTIAESKKKRRKDSIPRPLNSFMLFAQHIRRNVLRVFSDASNSVISQQLGDLWRTVPRSCRNQYDDEANRLSNSENLVLLPRMTNDLHAEQREELMNETIVLQDNNNHEMLTTDVLTPVYIQLDHEGHSPPTEGLMLTLPPGTTLIQTNNDHIHRSIPSKRFYITNVAYPDPILYSPIMSSSELLSSSSSYSCNSSPNSIVSPLSGDVFLPMQQVELMPNSYEQQSSCMDIYQFDEQNQLDIFDAMMNSIDITTFLPGTFQTNEEQDQSIHNDYNDVQLNSYNHQTNNDHHHEFMKMDEFDGSCHHIINDVMTTTTAVTTTPTATSSSSFMNKSTNSQVYNVVKSDIDYNSHHHQHYLGNTMNMNHENRTAH